MDTQTQIMSQTKNQLKLPIVVDGILEGEVKIAFGNSDRFSQIPDLEAVKSNPNVLLSRIASVSIKIGGAVMKGPVVISLNAVELFLRKATDKSVGRRKLSFSGNHGDFKFVCRAGKISDTGIFWDSLYGWAGDPDMQKAAPRMRYGIRGVAFSEDDIIDLINFMRGNYFEGEKYY